MLRSVLYYPILLFANILSGNVVLIGRRDDVFSIASVSSEEVKVRSRILGLLGSVSGFSSVLMVARVTKLCFKGDFPP